MADWRLAPTLVTLRAEVNKRWPIRDKTSDGTLGNAAHAAGTSDHNPDSRGVVCAIDFDEDLTIPAGSYPSFHPGEGCRQLVNEVLALARGGQLPQLYYLIYEDRIYSRTYGFVAREYFGSNPHDHHCHLSVYHSPALADSIITWGIYVAISDADATKIANKVVNALTSSETYKNAVADKVATRDGNVRNSFTDNPDGNTHVSIATALGVLGDRTKP